MTKRIVLPSAMLVASLLSPVEAQTPASWLVPVDGNWSDATRWSTAPLYPGQDGPNYHAQIIAAGTYTVTYSLLGSSISQLTLGNGARLLVDGGFNLSNLTITNSLSLSDATLALGGPGNSSLRATTISGSGTISILGSFERVESVADGEQLTIGSGIHVEGLGTGTLGRAGSTFINHGTIESVASFTSLNATGTFLNAGTIIATAGKLGVLVRPGFNTGTLIQNGGTLHLRGDVREQDIGLLIRNSGTVNIAGALVNAGSTTYLNAFQGGWTVGGFGSNDFAQIQGGTIAAAAGNTVLRVLNNASVTGGVQFDCDILLSASRTLQLFDSVQLNGELTAHQNGTIVLANSVTLNGTGTVTFGDGGGDPTTSGVQVNQPTIGSGIVLQTNSDSVAFSSSGTLTNQGTLLARNANRKLSFASETFLKNQGLLEARDGGMFDIAGLWSNSGRIRVEASSSSILRRGWFNTGTVTVDGLLLNDYTGTSPLSSIQSDLISGFAAGTWNGPGINSSIAASDPEHVTVLALPSNQLLPFLPGTYKGLLLDSTSILLLPALFGDTNLDGRVNTLDFNILAGNFGGSNPTWLKGDFDQDGDVDSIDFTKLLGGYGMIMPSATSLGAAVPEPSSCGVLLLVCTTLFRGHRR